MASRISLKPIRLERDTVEIRVLDGLLNLVEIQSIGKAVERVVVKISHQISGIAKVNLVQDGTQPSKDNWV